MSSLLGILSTPVRVKTPGSLEKQFTQGTFAWPKVSSPFSYVPSCKYFLQKKYMGSESPADFTECWCNSLRVSESIMEAALSADKHRKKEIYNS